MTDEEFIVKAKNILSRHGTDSEICSDKAILYLGSYSYMKREQMVEAAKEILILEQQRLQKRQG